MRTSFTLPSLLILLLIAALPVLLDGCASANRARFQDTGLTVSTQERALSAAAAALGQHFEGVRLAEDGATVVADTLYVDFGQTELDLVGKTLEKPDELTQALGRIRRTPTIRVVDQKDGYAFQVRVLREVEELEATYVAYDQPYDYNESSSMPTDPGRYSDAPASPPRSTWIPQGNDLQYEGMLKQALRGEVGG